MLIENNSIIGDKGKSILFEYEPKGKDYGNDMAVRIRIYKLEDADKNDAVNVADVTVVINYIMGRQNTGNYNIMLADMNNDGAVDIFDIMKLVNVILTGKLPDPNNAPMRSAGIYEDMLLAFSINGVTMGIPDAQRFTSFQFEIEIPDDVELTGAELIDASTNHMVQFAKIEDHHYRVVGLSIDNSILSGNNCNNLIDLRIPNCGRIKIHNAMFVSPQGQVTNFNDTEIEDGITGIRSTSISDKIQTIYNAIDVKVFSSRKKQQIIRTNIGLSEEDFVIIYYGRINKDKGVSELIDAMLMLHDMPNIKLMIIGSTFFANATNEDEFVQSIKEKAKKIEKRIVFTGFIPYNQVPNYLQLADIAVLPSMWDEPFGLTIVEALAAGLPLITTRSGGIPEICEGVATIVERENIVNNLKSADNFSTV